MQQIYHGRCNKGNKLTYYLIPDNNNDLYDIAFKFAQQFANTALANGDIKPLKKNKYENMLTAFIHTRLENMCAGGDDKAKGGIKVITLCEREHLPIYEHYWHFNTTIFKPTEPPNKKTQQIRHYAGEPPCPSNDLIYGLVMHIKPWNEEDDDVVRQDQNEHIKTAIDTYRKHVPNTQMCRK
ncbi:hypothetical protein EJ419_07175 [Alloscardovia theropitheci]|uniref:Uncharacterized protein n=1 Tax=Alloscardovia theropitheci TaxID=2496842 RepID=A0A4R0QW74_9BIFI|nr:hypothetical protein [Alloscardovia theropitheci]TCD53740.1 hypothetical protein EJ419_07175 [Alloscardovia theropitheci]